MAYERVTLYGVPLVADRLGQLRQDRPGAGPRAVHPPRAGRRRVAAPTTGSSRDNRRLLEEAEELEHRARRRDIVVDERHAVRLLRRADPRRGRVGAPLRLAGGSRSAATQPDLLTFDRGDAHPRRRPTRSARPRTTRDAGGRATLTLRRSPTTSSRARADDGVTVDVPLARSTRSTADGFAWHVPGLREELVTALIRSPCPRPSAGTSCRPPTTPGRPGRPRPGRRRVDHRRAGRALEGAHRFRRGRRGSGTGRACPTTCGSRSGSRTVAAGRWPRARTCVRSRSRWRRRCVRRWRRRPGPSSGRGWRSGASARCPRRSSSVTVSASSRASPRWWTTVTPSRSRCCRRSPSVTTRPGSACDDCCCSTRPRRGSGCSRCSRTPRSWPSATTRTAACPRCWTTAWPARSTRSWPSAPAGTVRTPEEFEETLAAVRRGVVPRVLR